MSAADILGNPGASGADWTEPSDYPLSGGIPPQKITHNGDGTKTVLDYSMSEDGYLAITKSVIKVEKVTKTVSKTIAARKQWTKFGDCAGKPSGLERGISTVSIDEVNIEWLTPDDDEEGEEEETNYAEMAARDIQTRLKMERFRQRQEERKLGVANWAQKMSMEAAAKNPNAAPAPGLRSDQGSGTGAGNAPGPSKYVPPSKRAGASGTTPGETSYSRDDSATVRISNISKNTEEADLDDLCKGFGSIRRIFLSRDRDTRESKGFAFVAFNNPSDAAKCIEKLNGHGYDHLILSVEWSKPKEPRDGDGARPSFSR